MTGTEAFDFGGQTEQPSDGLKNVQDRTGDVAVPKRHDAKRTPNHMTVTN